MGATRKKFDALFKREALLLSKSSGKSDRAMEQELGLYQGALTTWRREIAVDPAAAFPGTGHMKPLEDENRRLRRELDVVREEREILKKAVAIFSKEPNPYSGS